MNRRGIPAWLASIIGVAILVIAWWLFSLGSSHTDGTFTYKPVPSPWDVVDYLFVQGKIDGAWNTFRPTILAALIGFVWGNLAALVLAALVLVLPRIETVVMQIAVVTYCLPIVAVGGLAIVLIGGAKHPGDPSKTAILLAALVIFFTTVVGALLGFKSADRASLDVVRVYGGSRWTQLVKVRLVAALPAILNALQVAVPTSFLGAVLGEYMGATDLSVGRALISLQSLHDSVGVWSIFLLSAVVSFAGYAVVGLVARLITPWVSGSARA